MTKRDDSSSTKPPVATEEELDQELDEIDALLASISDSEEEDSLNAADLDQMILRRLEKTGSNAPRKKSKPSEEVHTFHEMPAFDDSQDAPKKRAGSTPNMHLSTKNVSVEEAKALRDFFSYELDEAEAKPDEKQPKSSEKQPSSSTKSSQLSISVEHTKKVDEKFRRFESFSNIDAFSEEGEAPDKPKLSTSMEHARKTDEKFERFASYASLPSTPAANHSNLSVEIGANPGIPSGEYVTEEDPHANPPQVVDSIDFCGQAVAGRFLVKSLLGEGGMGKVYLAEQLGLGRSVALKMLHPQIAKDEVRKQRFTREAQAMTRFLHPNSVAVYDYGEWKGQLFIAMELVEGVPLNEIIEEKAPFKIEKIVEVLSQVCDVLEAAHKKNLVHRDLKPENILLTKDDEGKLQIKLVDFGLALLVGGEAQQRLTQEGMMIGTPAYVSPEQAQGQEIDPRSDLYALGIICYEMLCGSLPFLGDNMMSLMLQHLFAEPQRPSERCPDLEIPPRLEKLILDSLSKVPDERPESAATFRHILQHCRGEEELDLISEQKRLYAHSDRNARAAAAGLPELNMIENPETAKLPKHSVLVVEAPKSNMESIIVGMWSNGFKARQVRTIGEVIGEMEALDPQALRVIVIDIVPDPAKLLGELQERINDEWKGIPVILVGPEGDFDIMHQALELGAHEFIPAPAVFTTLPKSLRKTIKRLARKAKSS